MRKYYVLPWRFPLLQDELKQSFECISDEKTACKAVELLLQEDEMTMNVAKVKNDVSTVHQIQVCNNSYYATSSYKCAQALR